MKIITFHIIIVCCAVFLCAASLYPATFTSAPGKTTALANAAINSIGTSSDSTTNGLSVDCNGRLADTKNKHTTQPLSSQGSPDTCTRWLGWIGINPTLQAEAKMQYDTLHRYIESCAKNDDSYHAFNGLSGAVQHMSDDPTRFYTFRMWLISVLYLNTTSPYYFCACLGDVAGTYNNPLATLAILKYMDTHGCSSPGIENEIVSDSAIDYQQGYDPTHLPTMHDLGLDSVLNLRNGVSDQPLPGAYLASFTSSPNPFRKETTLEFTLNRMAYVQVAVFDELGRLVWGDGKGSSLEAGTHDIHLDGSSLPSGTLYARISTGFGEVKTVKLVHE